MPTLYGLKSCDTCRKAMKSLDSQGIDISLHDVRADPLTEETLVRFHEEFGDALINRKSTTWRGLDELERSQPAVALLLEHPALMKRPVIENGSILTLGWNAEVQARHLG